MNHQNQILILGLGNPFRCDDAVGHRAVECLKDLTQTGILVDLFDGDELSLFQRWEGAYAVILIDAVYSGNLAGQIYRFDASKEKLPAHLTSPSSHAFRLAETIELARVLQRLPDKIIVYGIEGENFQYGQELSRSVEQGISHLIQQIRKEVQTLTIQERRMIMHEHSLINDLIAEIESVVEEEEAERASRVGIWLGALSNISPEHFQEHFVAASKGTVAEGAELEIETSLDLEGPMAQEILLTSIEIEYGACEPGCCEDH